MLTVDTVTLSAQFEVEIPLAIREALHLVAGDRFQVLRYRERVELIRVRPVEEMRGFLRGMDTTIEGEESGAPAE